MKDSATTRQQFDVLLQMASSLDDLGRYELSIQKLDQAIAGNPGNIEGYLARCIVLLHSGDTVRARCDAETAIRLDPTNGTAYYYLSGAHYQDGEYERAEQLCHEALERVPQDPLFMLFQARIYAKLDRLREAKQLFHQILGAAPSNHLKLIVSLHLLDLTYWPLNIEFTRRTLQDLLLVNPENPEILFRLAKFAMVDCGDIAKAEDLMLQVLRLNPTNASAKDYLEKFERIRDVRDVPPDIYRDADELNAMLDASYTDLSKGIRSDGKLAEIEEWELQTAWERHAEFLASAPETIRWSRRYLEHGNHCIVYFTPHHDVSKQAILMHCRLRDMTWTELCIPKLNLSYSKLSHLQLTNCDLSQSAAFELVASEVIFSGCTLEKVDFTCSKFNKIYMRNCVAPNIDFDRCKISESEFQNSAMPGLCVKETQFTDVTFIFCDLSGAKGVGAIFNRCKFIHTAPPTSEDVQFIECIFEDSASTGLPSIN